MKLTSPVFDENGQIPPIYSCDGDNISPPLEIQGVPVDTKSLVLIVHDPDAPVGDFLHWIMWDINPAIDNIEQNGVPEDAIQGLNSANDIGYTGPCPPSGTHHYLFELYALPRQINLPFETPWTDIQRLVDSTAIAKTVLTVLYTRQQI